MIICTLLIYRTLPMLNDCSIIEEALLLDNPISISSQLKALNGRGFEHKISISFTLTAIAHK